MIFGDIWIFSTWGKSVPNRSNVTSAGDAVQRKHFPHEVLLSLTTNECMFPKYKPRTFRENRMQFWKQALLEY